MSLVQWGFPFSSGELLAWNKKRFVFSQLLELCHLREESGTTSSHSDMLFQEREMKKERNM